MPEFDLDAALTVAPRPEGAPACVACGQPTAMITYGSMHLGYRAMCNCPSCHNAQYDFWQVVACHDGAGAPNLLLDGPDGDQTNDVERYRREAFCPACEGGDDHIQNLTWGREWAECEQDGALTDEGVTDYVSPYRCTWVECQACLFGWKEIYALTSSRPDNGGDDA